MFHRVFSVIFVLALFAACSPSAEPGSHEEIAAEEAAPSPLDTKRLESLLGLSGTEQDGQYKVTIPQSELSVSVDGFQIIPPMGLTSWAAFAPAPAGAIVMGDLVLLEDEILAVETSLIESGLTVSALHNHFVRDEPKVMFMHIHGVGDQDALARGVRSTLDRIRQHRREKGLRRQEILSVESRFDPSTIDSLLGHSGAMNGGVYKVTVGREEVELIDHGATVTSFLGFNTWMAFQGSSEKAAVCGDFAVLEQEVAPVIRTLNENGVEVVAVHNHMVTEQPRIFFLHFWGVGSVEDLARGLRAALDQVAGNGR